MSATVLILGANGRFGAAATHAFVAAGWNVMAQARRPGTVPPSGAHALHLGLDDVDEIARAAVGAQVVVHAVNPPYTRWTEQALPLARRGMEVAQRLGATFMLPGNVYNFGERMPSRLQVDTPQCPSTVKGRIRCAMEAEIAARTADGLRAVVLRAGDFFGCGTGSWLDLVIAKSLSRGRLVYPGPLEAAHAWAYLPDLARAFVAAAQARDLPAFARFHFAGHTLTGAEFLAALERVATGLGVRPAGGFRRGSMPWPLLRAGGVFVPMWREIAAMAYLWRVPHALDGTALAAAVGPIAATPIDDALCAALVELGFGPSAESGPAICAESKPPLSLSALRRF